MGELDRLKVELAAAANPQQRLEIILRIADATFALRDFTTARRAWDSVLKQRPNELRAIRGLRALLIDVGEHQARSSSFIVNSR